MATQEVTPELAAVRVQRRVNRILKNLGQPRAWGIQTVTHAIWHEVYNTPVDENAKVLWTLLSHPGNPRTMLCVLVSPTGRTDLLRSSQAPGCTFRSIANRYQGMVEFGPF